MAETVPNQTPQFGFLGMFTRNVLSEVHYYGLLLSEVNIQALKKGMGDMPWAENS